MVRQTFARSLVIVGLLLGAGCGGGRIPLMAAPVVALGNVVEVRVYEAYVKGDRVTVSVHSGLSALTLDADATTSGRKGDAVWLRNPHSGKLFRARVDGPNAASVQVDSFKP